MLIDTHAHIQFDQYASSCEEMLSDAAEQGVRYVVCPGIDLQSSQEAIQLAENYDEVYAVVGVHPHDCEDLPDDWLTQIEEMAAHPKVVALGEMGLDYFKEYTPRDLQQQVFRQQLELAASLELPVVIHNRDGDEDLGNILEDYGSGYGVLHCYTSTLQFAQQMTELGYLISFTGIATFGNRQVEEAITGLALDKMMVETDSPFLAPVPNRGKTNQPAYVRHVAEKVAELKGVSFEQVEQVTTRNALQFFNLPS